MAKKKTQLHYNGPDLKRGRNVGSSDAHASSFLYFFLFLSYPFFLKKKTWSFKTKSLKLATLYVYLCFNQMNYHISLFQDF
jgi:hypothetical protein